MFTETATITRRYQDEEQCCRRRAKHFDTKTQNGGQRRYRVLARARENRGWKLICKEQRARRQRGGKVVGKRNEAKQEEEKDDVDRSKTHGDRVCVFSLLEILWKTVDLERSSGGSSERS